MAPTRPDSGPPGRCEAVTHKLGERVKELTALHRTARILQDHGQPVAEVLRRIVDLLPPAWQHPEVTAARIRWNDEEYLTPGFRETAWAQTAAFATRTGAGGSITVVYLEARPPCDEGPFLREERDLIDSLVEMLRSHLEHVLADEALRRARDSLETEVAARTADLRRLASRLTLAEEKERRRIAGDLHDHIGQALAIIKLRLHELKGNAIFGGFEGVIDEIQRLLDQTIRYTRDLTGEISPPVLYELGLEPALDWLAEQFTVRHRFRVHLAVSGQARPLPEELAVMLFKSARELLVNAMKHSGAPEAEIRLAWERSGIRLTVSDQGCGGDPGALAAAGGEGFGLFSIRERFGDLGGRVEVATAPGAGCRVTIRVPG